MIRISGYFGIVLILAVIVALIWRRQWVIACVKYVFRDEMPIWLSITLAISAAAGTYWIAPLINETFEFQKNRSAHILSTVGDINKDMVNLVVDVRKFNETLFFKKKDKEHRRGDLLDQITQIQWRLLDVNIIIDRAGGDGHCVQGMKDELEKLDITARDASKPEDQEQLINASLNVSREAQSCLLVLYKAARLD